MAFPASRRWRLHGPTAQARGVTGHDALGDWKSDSPGVRRKITVDDLPRPFDTPSANNHPRLVSGLKGRCPAQGISGVRIRDSFTESSQDRHRPNGDIFVAESGPGRIKRLRDTDGDGTADTSDDFATRLTRPFGIAFYPPGPSRLTSTWEIRTPSSDFLTRMVMPRRGDRPRSSSRTSRPAASKWAAAAMDPRRAIFGGRKNPVCFRRLSSNVSDDQSENRRADILAFNPDGSNERIYAYGIRNAVGLAIHRKPASSGAQ